METKTAEPSVTANASSSHPQTADFGVRIGASVDSGSASEARKHEAAAPVSIRIPC
jgi:hypothetical protein